MNDLSVSKVLSSFEQAFCDLYKDRKTGQLLDSYIKSLSEDKRVVFRKVLQNGGVDTINFSGASYESIIPATRGQVLGLIAAALAALMSIKSLRSVVANILKTKFFANKCSAEVIEEVLKLVGGIVPSVVASVIAITRLQGGTRLELKERPRLRGY